MAELQQLRVQEAVDSMVKSLERENIRKMQVAGGRRAGAGRAPLEAPGSPALPARTAAPQGSPGSEPQVSSPRPGRARPRVSCGPSAGCGASVALLDSGSWVGAPCWKLQDELAAL